MRIDVVSIFPDYLAPLDLSLVGKARASGVLEVEVHDLRGWTHDQHHTTDDTPYGGGAGMVMKPEPWGEALDALLAAAPATPVDVPTSQDPGTEPGHTRPLLVVPTPSGTPFTQRLAEEIAGRPWLIFACGRYEGIDQRVIDDAATTMEVLEVSVGDYVLNGGEVAALVLIESVARLLPGFLGNPESLTEESHSTGAHGGLLEYPVYTKPPTWRGRDVPEVLRSGHHGRIAQWRRDQALRRTAQRRPDLLHHSQAVTLANVGAETVLGPARPGDAPELLTLQRACWMQEAQANGDPFIPPLVESLADVVAALETWQTFVVRSHGRMIGSVRAGLVGDRWEVGRIMVVPDLQGRGLGRWLLEYAEAAAPDCATAFTLFTGTGSADNLRMYRKAGYRAAPTESDGPGTVRLTKSRR